MRPALRILLLAVLAPSVSPCRSEPLGRLFLTPEQRTAKPAPSVQAKPTAPTINGIIRSQSGSGTIWINGRAQKLIAAESAPQETTPALSENNLPETAQ